MKTKTILFISLALFNISLLAQKVGIYNQTVSIVPTNTLANGTSFSGIGSVVNTSTVTFSNKIDVNLAIDTSTTGIPKWYWRSSTTYSVTNFAPGQTFTFSVNDVISTANGYKTTGNGTTVVFWPIIGSATNTISICDSARTSVFIDLTSGIDVLDSQNDIYVQNPSYDVLSFEVLSFNYEPINVEFINTNGECVLKQQITTKNSTLNTNYLYNGIYHLMFINKKTQQTNTKKIIIQN